MKAAVRELSPDHFALVMATGIVSQATRVDGARRAAGLLLGVAAVAWVALAAAYSWRLARYRGKFLADARDPSRAFGYFTFVAGSGVLGAQLALDGDTGPALTLLVLSGSSWLLLSYSVPLLLAAWPGATPALGKSNGTWFLWVVGAQSIAVLATVLPAPAPARLAPLAIGCWAVGVVLYIIVSVMVAVARLQYRVQAAEVTPAYWVFMGATAISVLAGARLLRLPAGPLSAAAHEVVAGLSIVLWAFGTWLIPLLLALGAWRYLAGHVPVAYEPGLWSMVFPLGMYGVASHELGAVLGVPWLVALGQGEAWLALGVWVLVAVAMAWAAVGRLFARAGAR